MISALLSVLHLSRKLIVLFLNLVLLERIQKVIFDAVLNREGLYDVVFNYNIRNESSSKVSDIPTIIFGQLIPFVLSECACFFVQCIPLIGPLIVLLVKAPKKAFSMHQRYFKLMNFNFKKENSCFSKFRSEYLQIGVMVYVLEMIPCMTIFFLFTNNIGMALWTVDQHEAFIEGPAVKSVCEDPVNDENHADSVDQNLDTSTGRKRRPSLKLLPFIVKSRKRSSGFGTGTSQNLESVDLDEQAQE